MQFEDSVGAVSDVVTYISAEGGLSTGRHQIIDQWSVAGHDRIVGTLHTWPGQPASKAIITSPIVRARLVGDVRMPVVVTESGSIYWLGSPSSLFGAHQAAEFLSHKVRQAGAPALGAARRHSGLHTSHMSLAIGA